MTKPKNLEQMDGCLLDTGSRAKAICRLGECIHCGWNPRIAEQRRKKVRALFREKKLPRREEPEIGECRKQCIEN